MQTVNMHEAKTHLSKLVDAAAKGEPFIIAKADPASLTALAKLSAAGVWAALVRRVWGPVWEPVWAAPVAWAADRPW